ncbi:LytTR family transcriptional regulator DNA-binding domain-containing protein [Paenibacillus sp. GYB004]|uniref:LytTR family transcriptional regulator DNA-binding domain-containing protein n=1 Tax=Paenibacillus sp. GYB004 TaxID=2994393 RepID=UPI003FA7C73C
MDIFRITTRSLGRKGNGEEPELRTLDLNADVNFIQMEGKLPVYYTTEGPCGTINTLDMLERLLEPVGYIRLDAVNLVKISRIKWIEARTGWVHFLDGSKTQIALSRCKAIERDPDHPLRSLLQNPP